MAFKSFYSVRSRLLGERSASSRIDYLNDAMASVTATTNASGGVLNTYRLKPYGGLLSNTGAAANPRFNWAGQWGYRSSAPGSYVRARHYSEKIAAWTSKERALHAERYTYCRNNPTTRIDRSGLFSTLSPTWWRLFPQKDDSGCSAVDYGELNSCCKRFLAVFGDSNSDRTREAVDRIQKCMAHKVLPPRWIEDVLDHMRKSCAARFDLDSPSGHGLPVCVFCFGGDPAVSSRAPAAWNDNGQVMLDPCRDPKRIALSRHFYITSIQAPEDCTKLNDVDALIATGMAKRCVCSVILCKSHKNFTVQDYNCKVLMHELIHCAGIGHGSMDENISIDDSVSLLGRCIYKEFR